MNTSSSPLVEPAGMRIVSIGELQVSATVGEVLITYALGSCLAVCIHDPVARVGGMLHAMLPEADRGRPARGGSRARFIDVGVPRLFRECYALGARKERLVVKIAGGARVTRHSAEDYFRIGERNVDALRRLLGRNGVPIAAADVGGQASRTVSLQIGTGIVTVKSNGVEYEL